MTSEEWNDIYPLPNPNQLHLDFNQQERMFSGLETFKEITGWDTSEEMAAYNKGREHEQIVTLEWIKDWDGSSNSVMGQILRDKFLEIIKLATNEETGTAFAD